MDLFSRYRNLSLLLLVLFAQVIGLAVQVKRPGEQGSKRLITHWGVALITPVEKALVHSQDWLHDTWHNYFYLRDVRRENQRLEDENARLRLDQVRMVQDASQAQRLQALLKFKEQFISETVAAQVVGSSGSEQSRILYLDKGQRDGLKPDMAVISPGGIVGKIIAVFPTTAEVLEINDSSSGVGAILEKSRLQGILKGTPAGEVMVHYIMSDEEVEKGEMVLTSGGDRIFPKGLPIGRVSQVNPGPDMFLNIRVKPAARLDRLEEVLVITKVVDKEPELTPEAPRRASDILAQRLPTVQPKPPDASATSATAGGTAAAGANTAKPAAPGAAPTTAGAKPATAAGATPGAQGSPGVPGSRSETNPGAPGSRSEAKLTWGKNAPATASGAKPVNGTAPATNSVVPKKPASGASSAPGGKTGASPVAGVKVITDTPVKSKPKAAAAEKPVAQQSNSGPQ